MSHLADIVSNPAALSARLRVAAIEPVETRKAARVLRALPQHEDVTAVDVADLQQRVADAVRNQSLSNLTRREIREGGKLVLHPPFPIANDGDVVGGLLRFIDQSKRRAAFFAVVDAYLDRFEPGDPMVATLAAKLKPVAQGWSWRPEDRLPELLKQFSLLDPKAAPQKISDFLMDSDEDLDLLLNDVGLGGGRRFGGLIEAAFRHACDTTAECKGAVAEMKQRRLMEWAKDDNGQLAYRKSWSAFVKAVLTPWKFAEPSEEHKAALINILEEFGGGDPRAKPEKWREVMDSVSDAYGVLIRWLTRASVRQFFDVVDRLMPDLEKKKMWAYRRAFWTSYLLSDGKVPSIDAAWVAFGEEGARLAKSTAHATGDNSFRAFGRQNDMSATHAALIMEIGDLTIVEWSHNGKYQVWKKRDPKAPKLFELSYRGGSLYSAPLSGSHSAPAYYNWQKKVAEIIEEKPVLEPRRSWRPRGV